MIEINMKCCMSYENICININDKQVSVYTGRYDYLMLVEFNTKTENKRNYVMCLKCEHEN